MKYRDGELEKALSNIANKKLGWQTLAPSVCARAMHRICELENVWDNIREAMQHAKQIVDDPESHPGWPS
jgi:hypothetical protein